MRGTYILVMYLAENSRIKIGKLGIMKFMRGYYCYVGSAFGKIMNLENRIGRHKRLNKNKKGNLRWHIDYLLVKARLSIKRVVAFNKKIECKVSRQLERKSDITFKGFGSSDCKCKGHLHYFKSLNSLDKAIRGI